MAILIFEHRVTHAEKSCEGLRCHANAVGEDAAGRMRIGTQFDVDHITDDAEALISCFACRHEGEVEIVENVAEIGIYVDLWKPELTYVP